MADQGTQTPLSASGRIFLGAYLFLVTALFAYVTAKLWPQVGGATQTIQQPAASPGTNQTGQAPPVKPPATPPATPPAGQNTSTATPTTGNTPAPQTPPPAAQGGAPSASPNPQTTTQTTGNAPTPPEPDRRPVQLFWGYILFSITAETRLILLVLVVGALGGCVHAATSFVAFAGEGKLQASWIWWYLLRAPISGALALIAYFAVRGGFFSASASTSSTAPVNDFGIVAMAGLVGMFTKQATAKLDEIFSTLFRTAPAAPPATSGGQLANKVPTLSAVNPVTIPHGGADTTITVTGDGFVDKSEVHWDGVALVTHPGPTGQLIATVPAAKLAAAGTFDVTVFNPAPGGGSSAAVKVTVS